MYVLVTEKNWLICKAHLRYPCNFITEYQSRTDPAMEIDMHIFSTFTQYGDKRIHLSRVTYERLAHMHSPCKCCKILPIYFQGLHVPCNTLACTLHPYEAAVWPVSSCNLFFDVQVVTLLLGKYTLFAHAHLCYPTTKLRSYFSTIFAAHVCIYVRWDVREALHLFLVVFEDLVHFS